MITKFVMSGKEIVLLHKPDKNDFNQVKNLCEEHGVILTCCFGMNINKDSIKLQDERLIELNIPVVFIAGVTEKCNKFDVQLCIRDYFLKEGYKVSQIGTKSFCELFGFHSFPRFMYDTQMTEVEKIVYFNRVCKHIEIDEKADVLIIGIPGGLMIYNNIITNRFGITAFEVSSAVKPDASVMCLNFSEVDDDFLDKVFLTTKHRLGFEIDCFNMSNYMVDTGMSKAEKRLLFITLDSIFVKKKVLEYKKSKLPVFSVCNISGAKDLATYIEASLLNKDEFEAV